MLTRMRTREDMLRARVYINTVTQRKCTKTYRIIHASIATGMAHTVVSALAQQTDHKTITYSVAVHAQHADENYIW